MPHHDKKQTKPSSPCAIGIISGKYTLIICSVESHSTYSCLPFKDPLNYLQQDKFFNGLNFNYLQKSALSILCQTFKLWIDSEFPLNSFQLGFLLF